MKLPILLFSVLGLASSCTLYRGSGSVAAPADVILDRHTRDLSTNCGPDDPVPPNRVDTSERLAGLRELMAANGVAAYIVPLDEEGRRTWISGFSGSNGDAIIAADQAACWTDGRYFIQAADQLDCNWMLMRMGQPGVPDYTMWLKGDADLSPGDKVGADPSLIGAKTWLSMRDDLLEGGIELVSIEDNLIDKIWTEEEGRPTSTPKDIVVHPLEYAGVGFEQKIGDLRQTLAEAGQTAMVITELDEIAWILNLRGEGSTSIGGLYHSPLFESQVLVTPDEVTLWIHTDKLNTNLTDHLQKPDCNDTCVGIRDIDDAIVDLASWGQTLDAPQKILLTQVSMYLGGASFAVYEALPEQFIQFGDSPVLDAKSVKNEVESTGMSAAHLRDAVACCTFFAELERSIVQGEANDWTEMSVAERLSQVRLQQEKSRGDSFTTIAGSGSNGAIIHYSPTEETNALVNDSAVLLVDSGGQYLDGTTDITRTFFFGPSPPEELIDRYTRVLQGAIDLAKVIVPKNTVDTAIDLATRQYLYNAGLDYSHGTGHGIGAYLSVHEGPTSIRMRQGSVAAAGLKEGMFFSDEPGYYKEGEYGIRLESIVKVVKKNFPQGSAGDFITFESITLVPFEPKLINFSQMLPEQIEWYNDYNTRIITEIVPILAEAGDTNAVNWVYDKTLYVDTSSSDGIKLTRRGQSDNSFGH